MTETYCVYDLRDSLVLVVQPEGAAALRALPASSRTVTIEDNASNANNALYREYCFGYTWDGRGDLVAEHAPGGGTTERVYDARGRLVLETGDLMSSVDASLTATSQPRYVQTTYDVCDRVVRRRVVRTSTSLGALRAACDTSANVPALTEAGFTQICLLYSAEYFPFSSVTDALTGFTAVAGVVTASDVETANVKGMLKSEVLYPAANADGTAPAYGGITRTKLYYYDYRGRVVQMAEYDSDGWSARYSTKYDFCGNVVASKETHTAPNAGTSHCLYTYNNYDSRGRIITSGRELDGNYLLPVCYTYDELGRLSRKEMGDGPEHIGDITFGYDLHGWTTGIEARNNWGQDLVFGETLRYASPTKPGSMARYDGNISEITFSTGSATDAGTYGYTYDGLKRLTDAAYYAGTSTSQSLLKTEKDITYDRNGNITGLNRYGAAGLSGMLSFTHAGNRLSSVQSWDGENLPQIGTFTYDALGNQLTDGKKGLQMEYNLLNLPREARHMNDTVSYRYLADGTKLSALTNVGDGLKYRGSFVYEATVEPVDWYDDMGNHITDPILWESLASISWDEGRIVFDNPFAVTVDSIATDEPVLEEAPRPRLLAHGEHIEEPIDTSGANAWMVGAMHDEWFIKDHLGSVRAVVNLNDDFGNATDRILEVNDYLPFGTRIPTDLQSTTNRHRFSGKEEQRFGSLDLGMGDDRVSLNLLDFGARYYDPFTARWTTSDPMAGKYHSLSPYNYCAGNPVNLVDPEGRRLVYAKGVSEDFKKKFAEAISIMNEKGTSYNLAKLEASDIEFIITEGEDSYNPKEKTISWDPSYIMENKKSNLLLSPLTALAHEAGHAAGHLKALQAGNEASYIYATTTSDSMYTNKEERRVITQTEQYAAKKHGEIVEGQQTRTNHEGHPFPIKMKSFSTLRSIMEFVSYYNSIVNNQSSSN